MCFILQKKKTIYSTSRENKTTSDLNLQQLSEAILPKQFSWIFLPAANSFSVHKMGHDSVFRKKYASAEKNDNLSHYLKYSVQVSWIQISKDITILAKI